MKTIKCDIQLPASKSESNRALMIAAYGGFDSDIQNLSKSTDTELLKRILENIGEDKIVDVKDCGTAARFMLTYLAGREGDWLLTGTKRMQQRPMQGLITSLRQLGAEIYCIGEEGFLPIKIVGKQLKGGSAAVDVTHSSQYASSLLLAAPMWTDGLELELCGKLNSLSYIDMTIAIMCHYGAEVERVGRKIIVKSKSYCPKPLEVEPDWSAASYWFEIAALSDGCDILLKGLSLRSLQGDVKVAKMAELIGVRTAPESGGLRLKKEALLANDLSFDFSDTPDLFPAVVVMCAGLGMQASFTGIANLADKESDRVEAMMAELSKIGSDFVWYDDRLLLKSNARVSVSDSCKSLAFNTYNDHRVAMALAPLQFKIGPCKIDHPEVVAKSYPDFWDDFIKYC